MMRLRLSRQPTYKQLPAAVARHNLKTGVRPVRKDIIWFGNMPTHMQPQLVPLADSGDAVSEIASETNKMDESSTPVPVTSAASAVGEGTADAPMEIVDVEDGDSRPAVTISAADQMHLQAPGEAPQQGPQAQAQSYPGGFAIDVCFEASKLPLDVAIFNSARAAGGDEKIRKYLQAVLVVGGCALVPGMAHALESR